MSTTDIVNDLSDNINANPLPNWIGEIGHRVHIDDLKSSGLTLEFCEKEGVGTVHDPREISRLLNWKSPAKNLGTCLAFPYYAADGTPTGHVRLKPEHPRVRDGKPVKYEAPYKQPNLSYLPELTRQAIKDPLLPLIITEGEKKALAACQHGFPTIAIAGIWCWKIKKKEELLPDLAGIIWTGRLVFIVFDSDRLVNESIRGAERALKKVLTREGAIVRIVQLPVGPDGTKTGIDDFFVRGGTPEEFQDLLNNSPMPDDEDQGIIHVGADVHRMNDQAIAALANDPLIYVRGDCLVWFVADENPLPDAVGEDQGPSIKRLTKSNLQERLSKVCEFWKTTDKDCHRVPPPMSNAMAILERGSWPGLRRLTQVVCFPVLLPNGEILTKPGYERNTGVFYAPPSPVALNVPVRPTQEDACLAANVLLEVVTDVPFLNPFHRSAWLAALLTPLARYAFKGCSPLFLITANGPGVGKGLLADLIAIIIQGKPLAITTIPDNGEEFRKRVTALLIRGCPMVTFDNMSVLGGDELNALLTSEIWQDRLLGESRDVEMPNLTTWFATGNNVAVQGDTLRRVCPVRIESSHERPEERTDFKIPNLREWVKENRGRLVSAALTILRAYHLAGRPDMNLPPWGNYENWSALIRGAIVWARLPDPWEGRQGMRESHGDDGIQAFSGLLQMWHVIDPTGNGITCSQAVTAIDALPEEHDLSELLMVLVGVKNNGGKQDKRSTTLGYKFRGFANRNFDGRSVVQAGNTRRDVKRWKVVGAIGNGLPLGVSAGDAGDAGDGSSYHANENFSADYKTQKQIRTAENIPRIPCIPCGDDDDAPDDTTKWAYSRKDLGGIL